MLEIWAVLEHNEYDADALDEDSGELLTELAEIVQRQPEETALCVVLLISPQAALADMTLLSSLGVQHLYLLEHPDLAHYTTQGYVDALAWLLRQRTPILVATSATANGRDWMPRLAARLHLPFVPGCLGLDLHDDAIFALRAVYEGRAYIQTRTEMRGRTALATFVPGVRGTRAPTTGTDNHVISSLAVRGTRAPARGPTPPYTTPTPTDTDSHPIPSLAIGTRAPARGPTPPYSTPAPTGSDSHPNASPAVSRFTPQISGSSGQASIQRLAIQTPVPEEVELDAADRIIAGGRGVGREGFTYVTAFARLLGAAVGATRVATDHGWVEHARQIGTTGKSVHPRLYIACGISGAAQHMAGMRDAQTVVAINPDRTAPIFALADLGLLGDANAILPLAAKMIDHL